MSCKCTRLYSKTLMMIMIHFGLFAGLTESHLPDNSDYDDCNSGEGDRYSYCKTATPTTSQLDHYLLERLSTLDPISFWSANDTPLSLISLLNISVPLTSAPLERVSFRIVEFFSDYIDPQCLCLLFLYSPFWNAWCCCLLYLSCKVSDWPSSTQIYQSTQLVLSHHLLNLVCVS